MGLSPYFNYVLTNSLAELRHRFAGSGLGVLWLVVFPVAQIAIYSLVFSGIMQARLPELVDMPISFTVYLCSGLLPWLGFVEIVTHSISTLVALSALVTRTGIPEPVLFAQRAFTGFLGMLLTIGILMLVVLAMGVSPHSTWVYLPLILALFASLGFGVGMAVGILNVFARDVAHVTNIFLQIAMWTAPIIYTQSILPESIQRLLPYNPLHYFMLALHETFLFGRAPTTGTWAAMCSSSGAAVLFAYALLRVLRSDLRDEL